MSDLIRREEAIDAMIMMGIKRGVPILEILPSAEPERKTGFWKDYGSGEWHCSECGLDVLTEGSWEYPESRGYNFCPHCGADMTRLR